MQGYKLSRVYQHRGACYGIAYHTTIYHARHAGKKEIELIDKTFTTEERANTYLEIHKNNFVDPFVVQLNLV